MYLKTVEIRLVCSCYAVYDAVYDAVYVLSFAIDLITFSIVCI